MARAATAAVGSVKELRIGFSFFGLIGLWLMWIGWIAKPSGQRPEK
jgi:hypothetical protein